MSKVPLINTNNKIKIPLKYIKLEFSRNFTQKIQSCDSKFSLH